MQLSLRTRLALVYSVLLIVVIGGLSVYLWTLVQQTNLQNLQGYLLSEARIVALDVEREQNPSPPTAVLQALADYYGQSLALRVTILLSSGEVAGESNSSPSRVDDSPTQAEIQQALAGKETALVRFSTDQGQDLLFAAVPIHLNGAVIGVVRLAVPLTDLQMAAQRFEGNMLLAVILTILAAVGLAYLLSRSITLPIRQLTRRVIQTAGSDPDSLPREEADETAQLEKAFDRLETQLNSQIAALTAEQGTLSSVLNAMTDGMVIVDAEGRIRMVNPAVERIFNISSSQAIGSSLIEALRTYQLVDLWQRCQATGEQQADTIETSPNRLYIQAIAVSISQAMPGSTLLLFQDLTRMRRLEVVRRDFVSNVSHELRTPLASLKALTETLEEGALEDPPAARRFLLRMENEIDNLTQMVTELLELSRIESGRVPLKRRPMRPVDLVEKAYERMQLQAERTGLEISYDCPPDLPLVNIDSSRMEQVMVNLIHNAIKFTPPGGKISIQVRQQRNQIIFAVRDTGVGISADALPRIFERFYKEDRSRSSGGTGLGLSIARHLVEGHGGQIWAESEPGKGSTFYFSLPEAG